MLINSAFNQAVEVFNSGYNEETFKVLTEGVSETFYRPVIENERKFPYSFIVTTYEKLGRDACYVAELGRVKFVNGKAETDGNSVRFDISAKPGEEVVLLDIIGLRFYKLTKGAYNHLLFLNNIKKLDKARYKENVEKEELGAFREYWDKQIQQRV